MIRVRCPSCGQQIEAPEDKAGKKGKCKCGAVVTVPAKHVGKPPVLPDSYHLRQEGRVRSVTLDELKEMARNGLLKPDAMVCKEGLNEWLPVAQLGPVVASPTATMSCPACGETILAVARKCKHCGEYLQPPAAGLPTSPSRTGAQGPAPRTFLPQTSPRRACILMFVAFVVGCVLVLFNILVVGLLVKNDADLRMFAVATFTVRGMVGIVEIFAVFYLPLRWRRIMQEPTAYKVLGLVGGFGLIFLLFCEGLLLLSSLAESAAS